MPPRGRKNTAEDRSQEDNYMLETVMEQQLMRPRGFFDVGDVAQVNYEMLRYVANRHSINEALRAFGFSSRKSYYRARATFEENGLASLVGLNHGTKLNRQQTKNRTADDANAHTHLESIEQSLK